MASHMEEPTLTLSRSSKGLPQGPDPSRQALTQGRATDLRAPRDILWGCRAEHLALWVAYSMDSRSVIIDLDYFPFHCNLAKPLVEVTEKCRKGFMIDNISVMEHLQSKIQSSDFSRTFSGLCTKWMIEMNPCRLFTTSLW